MKRIKQVDKLFINALNNGVFPGAAFSFSKRDGMVYDRLSNYYGYAQTEPQKKELTKDTVFDLASLTKVLTTVPLLLAFINKGSIGFETSLGDIFLDCPDDKAEITISQLMSHAGGFVAHREFFNELILLAEPDRKKQLLRIILDDNLITDPGSVHCYSDIGYILLGLILEKLSGQELSALAKNLIYQPVGLENELFFPELDSLKREYASTEKCIWTGKMLNGQVHDDNCRAMGGVAGHAGLFGTLHGVLSMAEHFLDQWKGRGEHSAYPNNLVQRILEPVENSGWIMGFDMVSEKGSSSGNYFSKKSVGHLGFTGTSFWIDPVKECIVVLLTNRVHPSRGNWKIKEFRPVFHDFLMRE
jgi:CubicO group peptidase (beta-lactamase class C family)